MTEKIARTHAFVLVLVSAAVLVPRSTMAQCPHAKTTDTLPKPILYEPSSSDNASVVGHFTPQDPAPTLIVCIHGNSAGNPPDVHEGTFTVTAIAKGTTVVAQLSDGDKQYGPPSNSVTVGENLLSKAIVIGGLEQGTYSSLGQNTNPFLNLFLEGPDGRFTGWGRVRLLSAPQPSTQGIISTFSDPTGQLTNQSYTQVGQALDFVVGPRIGISSHWSFIADFGLTTPLNSGTATLTYMSPAFGTLECATMISRFSAANGYNPGLTAANDGKNCLAQNGTAVSDVAFSNQDRSSFLLKYGAGFRTSNKFGCKDFSADCTPAPGVLDITFGQDEAVSRGLLRHVVFKLDGMLPIPTGKAAYVYLFGSAYVRLAKNQDLSPLILQTATGVTIPSASVVVLPLKIPDRDFYRLGVGLNINQIFCKMFSCPNQAAPSPGGGSAQKTL